MTTSSIRLHSSTCRTTRWPWEFVEWSRSTSTSEEEKALEKLAALGYLAAGTQASAADAASADVWAAERGLLARALIGEMLHHLGEGDLEVVEGILEQARKRREDLRGLRRVLLNTLDRWQDDFSSPLVDPAVREALEHPSTTPAAGEEAGPPG